MHMMKTRIPITRELENDLNRCRDRTGIPVLRIVKMAVLDFVHVCDVDDIAPITAEKIHRGDLGRASVRLDIDPKNHEKLKELAAAAGIPTAELVRSIIKTRVRTLNRKINHD